MGLFGGMLGIGGSVIMIPALTLFFGENQHLYQASAMICNFCVASSAVLAHRKAKSLVKKVLKWLIPGAIVGTVAGVALSNSEIFAGYRSYILARLFGFFLIYVIIYNCWRFYAGDAKLKNADPGGRQYRDNNILSLLIGTVTGIGAGLLGMGAGTIETPLQQVVLRMPLRRAMSNSAATIMSFALIGATYKNITLPQHGIAVTESLRIAVFVIPTAFIGGFFGGHLMHILPKNLVRVVFIIVLILASLRLITV
jgi:uncharacterized membrane protein YfcA